MVEKQRLRIEDIMAKAVDDIDKTRLRKMQADMHKCAAQCCEDTTTSMDQTHRCVEQCSVKLEEAQYYVRNELQNFQSRLQRCIMQCNDDVKDKMGANPTPTEVEKYSKDFESCAVVCVDKYIGIIPNFVKKMKEVLAKGNIPSPNSE